MGERQTEDLKVACSIHAHRITVLFFKFCHPSLLCFSPFSSFSVLVFERSTHCTKQYGIQPPLFISTSRARSSSNKRMNMSSVQLQSTALRASTICPWPHARLPLVVAAAGFAELALPSRAPESFLSSYPSCIHRPATATSKSHKHSTCTLLEYTAEPSQWCRCLPVCNTDATNGH